MWEFIKGRTEPLYTMKLVPPHDLIFWEPKSVKVLETLNASTLQFISVKRCLMLDHTLIIKKYMLNEFVFVNLVLLNETSNAC